MTGNVALAGTTLWAASGPELHVGGTLSVALLPRRKMASRTSRGVRPLAARTAMPVAMRRLRPATRTMKNSSRLLAKMARNLARSRIGRSSSSASSSTRWLKASHDAPSSWYSCSFMPAAAAVLLELDDGLLSHLVLQLQLIEADFVEAPVRQFMAQVGKRADVVAHQYHVGAQQ